VLELLLVLEVDTDIEVEADVEDVEIDELVD